MQTDIIRGHRLKVGNEITNVFTYYPKSLIPSINKFTARYKELAKKIVLVILDDKPIRMGM